jgi:hypothetical protein
MALVRAAVTREVYEEPSARAARAGDVARVYLMLEELDEPPQAPEGAIYAAAKERPVLIAPRRTAPRCGSASPRSGQHEARRREGARGRARDARHEAQRRHRSIPADEISLYIEVSQERIEAACKLRVPKGKGAEKMRAVIAELKRRGGATKPVKHDVDLYKIRPHALAAKAG